jgi:hypothetical protein
VKQRIAFLPLLSTEEIGQPDADSPGDAPGFRMIRHR